MPGKRAIRAPEPKTLAPVRPNVGIQTAYQRKLERLIEELNTSITYWVLSAYEAHPPELANDKFDKAAPADVMKRLFRRLARRWNKKFDEMAPKMAAFFADKATDRADTAMAAILKEAGWTVKFTMGPTAQDAYKAIVAENVGLIRNLSQEHLFQVEGLVMRSVQSGHDAGTLAKALQDRYAMTRRRAALIARDQNNKATAVITRVRQQDLGMTEAVWQHSTAGRHPRPEHVAFNGKRYEIAKGVYLDGKWVWPGTEINCRCVSKPIIPGFD